MTGNVRSIKSTIDEPIFLNPYDESHPINKIFPERTIISYKNHNFHIYSACYSKKNNRGGRIGSEVSDVNSNLCPVRCKVVEEYIRRCRKVSKGYIVHIHAIFDWLENNGRMDFIHSHKDAFETYYLFTENLYREVRGSAIKGNSRTTGSLTKLQYGMQFFLSVTSGLKMETLKNSALRINQRGAYKDPQTRRASENDVKTFWKLHLRHFEAIASFLLDNQERPLIVRRQDLGFPDYKQWTFRLDSQSIERSKSSGNKSSQEQFLDANENFIFDVEAVKERVKELGHDRYLGANHHKICDKLKSDDEYFTLHLFRKVGIHFSYLLLMASGCNVEQLESIDFSVPLSTSHDAKRQAVTKARAGYAKKPVSFSAKFLPHWRKYLKIRALTIEKYDPSFGNLGIPLVSEKSSPEKNSFHVYAASAKLLRVVSNNALGFPEHVKILTSKSGRDFKTINFLELTGGDINKVSQAMGRTPEVTRSNYNYKSFEDSARELTSFFEALTEAATIKAKNYSPSVPTHTDGASIHTGSCAADQEAPVQIPGVTEFAPQPRCGAPLTCFFCIHFGHHADVHDVKLMLSAKTWLRKQTKAISRNIDEHAEKFLPIMERIDDILGDFKNKSEEHSLIYRKAASEIEAGKFPEYWKNKIDAFMNALEA